MQLVIWALVVLYVLYSQGTDTCPDKCSCEKASSCDGTNINCYRSGLTGVPTDNPTDTCYLNLWENKITTLPNGIFDALTSLETLDLESNEITTLPNGIFDALTSLQTL
ncbi:vasorin-like [Ostrea edulis]|uniref:vasorin-like n=1 Tax=Ostrea edulis TaxID=37623 RepID=UPI0024AF1F1B|nr:vasorin-like [Ostrea edulis]